MASINQVLLKYLDELKQEDFDRFKSSLRNDLPQGFAPIPRGQLENAKQLKVVELMVDQYGDLDAAHITVHVLKKIKKNKLATELENELGGKMSGVSEAPAMAKVPKQIKENKKKSTSPDMAISGHQAKPIEIDEYNMSSDPRGFCLIINNMDFGNPETYRSASDKDEERLKEVFEWLGFDIKVYQNQTAEEMKELLRKFGQEQHVGDCFVCCILSHGGPNGVRGTDNCIVSRDDIFRPFYGINCPSLIEKPKVFFIQACRGSQHHPVVQADSYMEDSVGGETEMEEELETDTEQIILNEADFLIARATVKGYRALRGNVLGSWFIRCLCKNLKTFCTGGTDINFILIKTNDEVSRKVGHIRENKDSAVYVPVAQMPIYKSSLRKSLVFRPVNN